MKQLSFITLLLLVLIYRPANAETIYAISLSQEDIQAAINEASNGDTIILPAGNATWTTQVEIRKGLTIFGSGIGKTIITKTGGNTAIYIAVYSERFRCSGVEFYGNNESVGLEIHGDPHDFRIDHNKFQECRTHAIVFYEGHQYGVIDHNQFIDNSTTDIVVYGDNDSSWARPVNLGGPDFVFVEDNNFDNTGIGGDPEHAIASNTGAKYVFRYNTISSVYRVDYHYAAPIDAHGYCYYKRGTRAFEVYENNIYSEHSYRCMNFRGGTGVVFNNTMTGDFTKPIHMTNYRSWTSCGGTGVEPDSCTEGYPCQDQIRELYFWNNTYNNEPVNATVDNRGLNTDHIVENRDYFHMEKPDYTPYTYPHPLVAQEEPTSIVSNQQIVDFIIYPNPVNDELTIKYKLDQPEYIVISITDFTGRIISNVENSTKQHGSYQTKCNTSHLKPGIYYICFETKEDNYFYKLIKL